MYSYEIVGRSRLYDVKV